MPSIVYEYTYALLFALIHGRGGFVCMHTASIPPPCPGGEVACPALVCPALIIIRERGEDAPLLKRDYIYYYIGPTTICSIF